MWCKIFIGVLIKTRLACHKSFIINTSILEIEVLIIIVHFPIRFITQVDGRVNNTARQERGAKSFFNPFPSAKYVRPIFYEREKTVSARPYFVSCYKAKNAEMLAVIRIQNHQRTRFNQTLKTKSAARRVRRPYTAPMKYYGSAVLMRIAWPITISCDPRRVVSVHARTRGTQCACGFRIFSSDAHREPFRGRVNGLPGFHEHKKQTKTKSPLSFVVERTARRTAVNVATSLKTN